MAIWHAIFRDDSTINQYDDKGNEVLFRTVLDHKADLKSLSIRLGERLYVVSLLDGMFNVGGLCMYILDTNKYPPNKLTDIRPIYFETWQQDFSATSNKSMGQKLLYTSIGFQATFEGRNVKRFLEVYDSGDCKVREK